MPVDAIDAQIAALTSDAARKAQEQITKEDERDVARKAVEKKVAEKQAAAKQGLFNRESFQKNQAVDQRIQQILRGGEGHDAAHALQGWQQNATLQGKLTDAQKRLFLEAMAQNPPKASEAGNALNRLTEQPGFQKAINTAQQMSTLQQGVLANPRATEKPVAEMLQSRFMQSPKADPQTKNAFLRFGMQQAQRGLSDVTKRTGDMLGSLVQAGVPRGAQRAALGMAQRAGTDGAPIASVDAFVQQAQIQKLPQFARGQAVGLLAKANGNPSVRDGFEQLAEDPKFKKQTAQNKGRFFSTIGSGRPSEYRAITDAQLAALHSPEFPTRDAQVGRFLGKMAGQVSARGAAGVDVGALIKEAKKSPLPESPQLKSAVGLSPEDAQKVRMHNRAQVLHFFNQLERYYDQSENKLKSAKYLEDVNALNLSREPAGVDTSSLSPEELAVYEDRSQSVKKRREQVQKLQREKARELKHSRKKPSARRAEAQQKRIQGRQPRYFTPGAAQTGAATSLAQAAAAQGQAQRPGLAQNPQRAQLGQASANQRAQTASGRPPSGASGGGKAGGARGGVSVPTADLAQAVAQLGTGPITPQRAGEVAQAIAQQVMQQVVAQVTEQLLGGAAAAEGQAPAPADEPKVATRTDGWGIKRTLDRDLGGAPQTVARPKSESAGQPTETELEAYTGRMLVKDPSTIRTLADLFAASWKSLTRPERALLKNLGWSQQTWDTKDTPAAKWPMAMATAFINLTPTQRRAVGDLGMSSHDWDKRVQALAMGKKA